MPNFVTKPIPADKPDVDKPDADKPDADHVERPWGSFKQYAFHEATTVSLMTVKPGRRLSLQSHTGRAELWFVLDDGALVQVDDWMRLDPDGRPRALNIERAFANLYFDRKRVRMAREFASHPNDEPIMVVTAFVKAGDDFP